MNKIIGIAIITVFGIIMMFCIAYFFIRVMINTAQNSSKNNEEDEK